MPRVPSKTIPRYQYIASDDGLRFRALKIYERHTRLMPSPHRPHHRKVPFRIREGWIDNGHEFQVKFRWHVEDQGIRHAYIRPSPQLTGGSIVRAELMSKSSTRS